MERIGIVLALLTQQFSSGLLQYASARSLEHMGARVVYRGNLWLYSDRLYSYSSADKRWSPLPIRGLFIDVRYPVVSVEMHKNCTDDDVKLLENMRGLRELNLAYCFNISDDAVAHLTTLPALRVLKLYRNDPKVHNNFTRGIIDLASQPRITDKSLEYLSNMTSLRELHLWDNYFSDRALLQLQKLTRLRILNFRTNGVSAEAIRTLRNALPNTSIDDGL